MENQELIRLVVIGIVVFVSMWLVLDALKSRKQRNKLLHTSKNKSNKNDTSRSRSKIPSPSRRDSGTAQPIAKRSAIASGRIRHNQVNKQSVAPTYTTQTPAITDRNIDERTKRERTKRYVEKLPHDYKKEDLVTVFIKAQNNRIFEGDQLTKLFASHDMLPGDRNIFHKHEPDNTGRYRLIFSVADGVKGTLKVHELPSVQTPALVFFTWLGTKNPLKYFDLMIATAHNFAKTLGGRLYTIEKEVWTDQTTNKTRDFIRKKIIESRLRDA